MLAGAVRPLCLFTFCKNREKSENGSITSFNLVDHCRLFHVIFSSKIVQHSTIVVQQQLQFKRTKKNYCVNENQNDFWLPDKVEPNSMSKRQTTRCQNVQQPKTTWVFSATNKTSQVTERHIWDDKYTHLRANYKRISRYVVLNFTSLLFCRSA